MAKLRRRAGVWGLVLTGWQIWKRIPRKHRKRVLRQVGKHGPKLAKQVIAARRRARSRRP